MQLSIKILENSNQITQDILQALLPQVVSFMDNGIQKVKNNLSNLIKNAIINTPEYSSLLNGKLMYEFGIPDSSSKLASLIEIWSTNIQYSYTKPKITGNQIKSHFSAGCIRIDFADVLYTDYALVIDSRRGYSLPWLEWLLLDGTKTIVSRHEVVIGSNQFSRTGNALMRSSQKSWKVPSEFAGTSRDNWITRAIDTVSNQIEDLLQRSFS